MKLLLKSSAIPNIHNSLTDGPFRLQTVLPVIERIRETFQCPSISIGVLHQGRTILVKDLGYADQAALRVPDGNTIYCLGSCTKALTAVALGLLVESGQVDWSTPIKEYVPEFTTTYGAKVGEKATLRDLLSHLTGLAPLLFAILGKNAGILPRHEDVVQVCSKVPFLAPFRSEWKYNNWPYALAARITEIRSGDSWQSQIHRILKTLGMDRSFTTNPDDENIAHGYKVFNDGRMTEDSLPLLKGGDAFDGSGSLRSCVHDMITWCKVLIQAMGTEPSTNKDFQAARPPRVATTTIESSHSLTKDSILKALRTATQPHFSSGQGSTTSLRPWSFLLPSPNAGDQHNHQRPRTRNHERLHIRRRLNSYGSRRSHRRPWQFHQCVLDISRNRKRYPRDDQCEQHLWRSKQYRSSSLDARAIRYETCD